MNSLIFKHTPLDDISFPELAKDSIISHLSDKDTIDDSDEQKPVICQQYYFPYIMPMSPEIKTPGNKKLKNELCRNFIRSGVCNYGHKCQFAHGIDQLRKNQNTNSKYKTKYCSSFFNEGVCMYGQRCNFLHNKKSITESKPSKVTLDVLLCNYPQLVAAERPRLRFFQNMSSQY